MTYGSIFMPTISSRIRGISSDFQMEKEYAAWAANRAPYQYTTRNRKGPVDGRSAARKKVGNAGYTVVI